MNVIAWDYAYCLYPLATLEYREAIFTGHNLPPSSSLKIDAIMEKYTSRRFTIFTKINNRSTLEKFGGVRRRLVGDNYTWVLRLPTDNVASPLRSERTPSRDPCVCTTWALDSPYVPCVDTTVLEDELIQFSYVDHCDRLASLLEELNAPVERKTKDR